MRLPLRWGMHMPRLGGSLRGRCIGSLGRLRSRSHKRPQLPRPVTLPPLLDVSGGRGKAGADHVAVCSESEAGTTGRARGGKGGRYALGARPPQGVRRGAPPIVCAAEGGGAPLAPPKGEGGKGGRRVWQWEWVVVTSDRNPPPRCQGDKRRAPARPRSDERWPALVWYLAWLAEIPL